jgi:hypothetical protein
MYALYPSTSPPAIGIFDATPKLDIKFPFLSASVTTCIGEKISADLIV